MNGCKKMQKLFSAAFLPLVESSISLLINLPMRFLAARSDKSLVVATLKRPQAGPEKTSLRAVISHLERPEERLSRAKQFAAPAAALQTGCPEMPEVSLAE